MFGTNPVLIRNRCPFSLLMKAASSSYDLFMALAITDQQIGGTSKNKVIVGRGFKIIYPLFVKPDNVMKTRFFTSNLPQIAHRGS